MAAPDQRGDGGEPRSLDDWLRPLFSDSILWPVLAVAAIVFVTLGASLLLFALVERHLFALIGLAIASFVSCDYMLRSLLMGRFGLAPRALLCLCVLSIAAAIFAHKSGAF
ncbi:MAG: hypothetical protein OXU92_06550 [Deltaproteobacteria bacterium]|nr:hypothetical protein [Deltaproteobacteria bacterium]MDD9872541.1 hypothetical protein [Deltaproteobacteria bacterium]